MIAKSTCVPIGLFALIFSFGASPATAEMVTVNIVEPLAPGLGTYYGNALSYSWNGSGNSALLYAGVFNTNVVSNGVTSPTFDSYCIDLYHEFNGPTTAWTATTTSGWNVGGFTDAGNPGVLNIGGALAFLYDQYDPAVVAAVKAGDGAKASLDAAALQVALWSVVNNGLVRTDDASNLDASTGHAAIGRFYFGPGDAANQDIQNQVYTLANQYIASIGTNSGTATFYVSERDAASQDLIGSPSSGPQQVVPEPASVALFAIGLGVVALRSRKARRSARA